ncbi:hypothetical protein LPJ53_004354 [Coemansia erecta]|uniref:DUF605-domain-containing protein n=1 Tax=Coemansia erecta TaxID=147472 RepID=A0A9W7XXY8_9FUNG|nr:hypothetical protein LPJ53_004354 [Coemansia erecta]
MADLADVPAELKHIQPYIQRAQEMSQIDPIVSYFCKYHAARISLTCTTPAAQTYLTQLLDQLELEKQALAERPEMQDDAAALAHCTVFALRVFAKADSEDRSGESVGKATARGFIVASQFLQVLECMGGMAEDVTEKIRYAKWRAAEILKAMREGREPVRPREDAVQKADGLESGSGWPSPPSAGAMSPAASAGLPDIGGLSVSASPAPVQPTQSQPQSQPQPQPQQPLPHQMDTLPNVPRSTVLPTHQQQPQQQPQQPPPSTTLAQQPALDRVSATFTPVPASSLPQLHDSNGELLVDPLDAKSAQKHARWAISALEYDDVETAVENLQRAIQVLQPYRKRT